MLWNFHLTTFDNFTPFIQPHRPIHNRAKQTLPFMRYHDYKIRPRRCMGEKFFAHNRNFLTAWIGGGVPAGRMA
jgi:hypothetical protein